MLDDLITETDDAITAALRELAIILSGLVAETKENGTDEQKQLLRDVLTRASDAMQE